MAASPSPKCTISAQIFPCRLTGSETGVYALLSPGHLNTFTIEETAFKTSYLEQAFYRYDILLKEQNKNKSKLQGTGIAYSI
jgi:hypothetical protein